MDQGYSQLAWDQLDELEKGDPDRYAAVLVACDLILDRPAKAQSFSTALTTREGIVLRMPVIGYPPLKIFWATGPTILAMFPHP